MIAAYLAALRAADRRARAGSVRDLAGPFAYRLDRGVLTATQNTRTAFKQAREDNLDDIVDEATIAHTDRQGARWTLGDWAAMNAATTGRQATSGGVADAVGEGGRLTVEVGACSYCAGFAGEAVIGEDPVPPYHPSCTCVAS